MLALRARQRGFIRFIDGFGVTAFRVVAAADKHAKAPLPQYFIRTAVRTGMTFQHFDYVSVRLTLQGPDIVTCRVVRAAQKRAVFTGAYNQFCPASGAGILFTHGEECSFTHNDECMKGNLMEHTFIDVE